MSTLPDVRHAARFPRTYFARDALELARDLLGQVLVHVDHAGLRRSGRIVETEAYLGADDPAAHSSGGRRTPRNEVMYGDAGYAYIYFVYGMHFCMNVVAATRGVPEAVLIRALEPLDGVTEMLAQAPRSRAPHRRAHVPRPRPTHRLADGPGKLCRALGIGRQHNGLDLVAGNEIFLERGGTILDSDVIEGPRVGIDYAGDALHWPLRFGVRESAALSSRRFPTPNLDTFFANPTFKLTEGVHVTIYNPTREERAFLYQEAQDLEPLIKELGSLTVMIEEVGKASDTYAALGTAKTAGAAPEQKRNRFRVTFMVAPESVGMRVQATNADLYTATIAAKQEALRQLNTIVNSRPRALSDVSNVKPPHERLH